MLCFVAAAGTSGKILISLAFQQTSKARMKFALCQKIEKKPCFEFSSFLRVILCVIVRIS